MNQQPQRQRGVKRRLGVRSLIGSCRTSSRSFRPAVWQLRIKLRDQKHGGLHSSQLYRSIASPALGSEDAICFNFITFTRFVGVIGMKNNFRAFCKLDSQAPQIVGGSLPVRTSQRDLPSPSHLLKSAYSLGLSEPLFLFIPLRWLNGLLDLESRPIYLNFTP